MDDSSTKSGRSEQIPYTADFESGSSGWSMDGLWHRTSRKAYTGSYSLWYGQASTGDYASGSNGNSGTAISPTIDLPVGSNPTLSFRSWYETEPTQGYDLKWVEVRSSTGVLLESCPPIDGPMQQWTIKSYSLSDFEGQSINIHFKFDTMDGSYNYEGWYIDDVNVQGASGDSPNPNDPSVTVYSTEYYHSAGSSNAWYVYKNDDGAWGSTATNKNAGDLVEKHFRVDKESHTNADYARLWIWMANTGCSGSSREYTHLLAVNSSPWMALDPCRTPFSSSFKWVAFDIPMNNIRDGDNVFQIEPTQPGTRGFLFGIDGGSVGVDSEIVDNGVQKPGELLWQLWVRTPYDYTTMYRFLVIETIDPNGEASEQYAMEGYAHYSLDDLDSMYFLVYDNPDGLRSRLWQTTTWQQNNDYQEANKHTKTKHWPHYRYDFNDKHNGQGGRQSPVYGEYYHWYRVEWGTRAPDGTTTSGRQVVLVDHVVGAPKTYNQYPDNASKPNNLGEVIDIRLNAYYEVDKTMVTDMGGRSTGMESILGLVGSLPMVPRTHMTMLGLKSTCSILPRP